MDDLLIKLTQKKKSYTDIIENGLCTLRSFRTLSLSFFVSKSFSFLSC